MKRWRKRRFRLGPGTRVPCSHPFFRLVPISLIGGKEWLPDQALDTGASQHGLGHMAVQYAKAMGLNVAAVDIDDAKLDLARRLGASVTVNAMNEVDDVFDRMHKGAIEGRIVLDMAG